MRRFTWVGWGLLAALALLLLVTLATGGCRSGSAPSTPSQEASAPTVERQASPQGDSSSSLTQADQGQGGVTVEAIWVTRDHLPQLPQGRLAAYPADRYALVHLTVDTHSVDLSRYDMAGLAVLSGGSRAPVAATAWLGISESGHHREGVLVFSGRSNEEWMAQKKKAELVLKGIAGVAERTFRWES